jgi:plastocyanin
MKRWLVAAVAVTALAVAVFAASSLNMPATVAVEIVNEGTTPDAATFEPSTINVRPRTTVVWTNTDSSAHTVTSREPAGAFDSGVMGPEEEFEFTFETTGRFEYYCKIHPAMVGSVVVE